MANDRQHILEIHRCCTRIIEESRTINNLLEILTSNLIYQESVLFNLIQIGENVNRLSDELKENNSNIPWHQIVGMRNVITHGYGTIDIESIADTIREDIPVLCKACEGLLDTI